MLKTTPEQRARLRFDIDNQPDHVTGEFVGALLDDVETLLGELRMADRVLLLLEDHPGGSQAIKDEVCRSACASCGGCSPRRSRVSKRPQLERVGTTTDGRPVVAGLFRYYDERGLPLDVVLGGCLERGIQPGWLEFYVEAETAHPRFFRRTGSHRESGVVGAAGAARLVP